MTAMAVDLTPTEDLILTLLVSRRRLGDRIFRIATTNMAALRRLQDKGLVNVLNQDTNDAVQVSLTDRGLVLGLEPGLTPVGCMSFYIGPRSSESRVDCEREVGHRGLHRSRIVDLLIAWSTDEAGGYASKQYGDELRQHDVERRARLTELVAEIRPDSSVDDYLLF